MSRGLLFVLDEELGSSSARSLAVPEQLGPCKAINAVFLYRAMHFNKHHFNQISIVLLKEDSHCHSQTGDTSALPFI